MQFVNSKKSLEMCLAASKKLKTNATDRQLKVAIFLALKKHKYNHPMETINYIQKLFDALKEYKRTEGDNILDTQALFGLIRTKDAYF